MARRPRLAAQAAAVSMRNRIPNLSDNEDEEMADVPPTDPATPRDDDDDGQQVNGDDGDDVEEDGTPSQASPQPSRSGTPRRRGRGAARARRGSTRSTRNRVQPSEDEAPETPSEAPVKRRGGFRGGNRGRWANHRKSGVSRATVPLDEDGNPIEVDEDELVLPETTEGEEKVAKTGELLGGREYKVRTFTIPQRGDKLFMLSTEPARCLGYRDSYLFFTKHKRLYKVLLGEDEKLHLVDLGIIPASYKSRPIGIVTARSVFREFGPRIVVGGKKVVDDYDEQAARDRGDVEGELADQRDVGLAPGDPYNRNQYTAFGATNEGQKGPEGKRKRIVITSDNWLFEHAKSTSSFNSRLAESRKANSEGLYDIHTNIMQWPRHMQPTRGRWEKLQHVQTEEDGNDNRLSSLKSVYSRNFRVHDFTMEAPPDSNLPPPAMEFDENSLNAIPTEVLDELPMDCLEALQQARMRENSWRSKWRDERIDGLRATFLPSLEWYPKT